MKAKIDSAKAGRTFPGKDGQVQVYEVVAAGVVYDCMSEKCLGMVGQEVEFEVKQPSDPKYHPTMKLPSTGGNGGGKSWGGGGKTYTPSFKDTREGAILSARTMALSYAKDLIVSTKDHIPMDVEGLAKAMEAMYPRIVALLDLGSVPVTAAPLPAPAEKSGNNGGEPKLLAKMIAEINSMASMAAFGTWWNHNQPTIKALSSDDRKALLDAKAKKVSALEPKRAPVDEGEIPFD